MLPVMWKQDHTLIFKSKLLKNIKSVEAGVEVYSFPFRKKKRFANNLINFSKNWLFKFKKSWAKSWYREIFCWDRVIGRNPWNWESPDEIGRVDRYESDSSNVSQAEANADPLINLKRNQP